MSKITIADLEVFYCVGVPDEERAQPQRLLVTIEMAFDFSAAVLGDRITKTIDYYEVAQFVLKFGEGRSWKLVEKLVSNLTDAISSQFKPQSVTVEIKKFPIPQARHISVSLTKKRP